MIRRFALPAFTAMFAAGLAAQSTVVSPAAWANVDSPGANAFPFGSVSSQFRYLNVHDDLAGTARTILSLAVRRSGTTSTSTHPPTSAVLDAWMSTAVTTGATVSAMFDSNHGPDRAQVLTARTISFPAAPTGLLPYPFSYVVPLDVPFSFGGAGPLAWEVQITSRPIGWSSVQDAVMGSSTDPEKVVSRYGAGCIATGRTLPFSLTGASNNNWPMGSGSVNATADEGPAGAVSAFLFGFLPFPTSLPIPGTTGFPSGTCFLHSDTPLSLGGTLDSGGGLTFRVPVPLRPEWNGLHVYGQVVALDAGANALGVVLTNGLDHQLVAPYGAPPGGRVYQSGSLAATGTTGPSQTLVVQFGVM
jgi:hypothetical protein